MKPNFKNSKFSTDYSFSSARSIVRTLSDSYSKQFCDTKRAITHAAEATEGRCLYCGRKMYTLENGVPVFSNTIHYDHIYPASKMNLFAPGNVAIACEQCNLAKSNIDPIVFYDIRTVEGAPLYIQDRDEFLEFLNNMTKEYRETYPKHYAAGLREFEDDDEFKAVMTELLYNDVSLASVGRYTHETSVNYPMWKKVVERAYENWAPMSAKDVEARIGYTNEFFESMFGATTKIEECSIEDIQFFAKELLLSKHESKNEINKYRMLIKTMLTILSEQLMSNEYDDMFKEVPTYAKIKKEQQ